MRWSTLDFMREKLEIYYGDIERELMGIEDDEVTETMLEAHIDMIKTTMSVVDKRDVEFAEGFIYDLIEEVDSPTFDDVAYEYGRGRQEAIAQIGRLWEESAQEYYDQI